MKGMSINFDREDSPLREFVVNHKIDSAPILDVPRFVWGEPLERWHEVAEINLAGHRQELGYESLDETISKLLDVAPTTSLTVKLE